MYSLNTALPKTTQTSPPAGGQVFQHLCLWETLSFQLPQHEIACVCRGASGTPKGRGTGVRLSHADHETSVEMTEARDGAGDRGVTLSEPTRDLGNEICPECKAGYLLSPWHTAGPSEWMSSLYHLCEPQFPYLEHGRCTMILFLSISVSVLIFRQC